MPKTFQEILPALEARLEQAKQGTLPLGHAMELRRCETRQAMGCPSDEELGGFVDGKLRVCRAPRWAEVGWHIAQCQLCQEDTEGLREALQLNLHQVWPLRNPPWQLTGDAGTEMEMRTLAKKGGDGATSRC